VRKISPLPGFEPWTVQPVANSYTDSAISAQLATRIKDKDKVIIIIIIIIIIIK